MNNRYTLGVIAALLAGCGSQVAPTGGAMIASHAAHKMAGSSGALIYAAGGCGGCMRFLVSQR